MNNKKTTKFAKYKPTSSKDWFCDNCLSSDINIFKDKNKEMDCFCNVCKEEHYIVSSWIKSPGKGIGIGKTTFLNKLTLPKDYKC